MKNFNGGEIHCRMGTGTAANIVEGIPDTPIDYEYHEAGYYLQILGNISLGFYKLTFEHADAERKGVVWRTKVILERSDLYSYESGL